MVPRSRNATEALEPRKRDAVTENARGLSRRLRLVSAALSRLGRRSPWIEPEVEGLDHHVNRGDVCVDVGAEYGLYTVVLAAITGPTGRVVAVEPHPSLARWLTLVARVLRIEAVTVVDAALSDSPGSTELSVPRRNFLPVHGRSYVLSGASNDGANTEFSTSRLSTVRMQTLDEMCRSNQLNKVHFVKADVEGAELAVLHGGIGVLRESRPTVLVEIEQRHLDRYDRKVNDIVDFLGNEGYSMHAWTGSRWTPTSTITTARRNYLFVHKHSETARITKGTE
ncbi:MAG: FkbM family methyltransferase [Rhodococcus sp. (in: high G+C Gram-positive bacteria)]|uniref:FkbM family methyltransferase n=1 Tax=Rhodococcus sp. TaxID=1831 RepID=UPI002AD9081F|nr:FkbM family methyltransferase [Rhodococcus sp. (in: high G+C Gram-positive bacteria)]MDZ7930672.1 FkbM family methyltransferase [Rhodococcus sp. (in: high G+C Gram-positive bacteria)]